MTIDYWDKPYKCRHHNCGKRFSTMSGVVSHTKTQHREHIKTRPKGTKPIYAIAAFRRIKY